MTKKHYFSQRIEDRNIIGVVQLYKIIVCIESRLSNECNISFNWWTY